MIPTIIAAAVAAIISTVVCYLIIHRRDAGGTGSTRYMKPEENSKDDDYLIFEEPGSYKATDVKNDMLYNRLKELMDTSKPFLNHGVRMNDIATAIGTNTSTLSNIINRRFNMSFTELINSYKVGCQAVLGRQL